MVGGGAAADGAVAGLRDAGFSGSIVLIGEERWAPYERPPLSKGYLRGEVPLEKLFLRPGAQYEYYGVEFRLERRALRIDLERRIVEREGGVAEPFDLLLLATGAEPVRLPDLPDAIYLRRLDDADRLGQVLGGGRLAILGAGFIGCEVAAAARSLGAETVLLEAQPVPLQRVLGPRLGAWLGEVHRGHGADLRTGTTGPLPDGPCLVAAGSRPRTELAEEAGLECDHGILVDAEGRTSASGVFAAGDCARFWSPIYERHVRVEHFQTAGRHGYAVGQAMAGAGAPFAEAPWFWSDQYDLKLQYAGAGIEWDEEVVRGSFGEPPFSVFQLSGGRLVGVLGVNDHHTVSRTRRLLEARVSVTLSALEDPETDLRSLLREGR